ncbi:hypothetical protein [Micromonospora sp. LA-10]|uniref:hypothetical protein n=1 Tax=Micromonospora sp. LA-10 TaxID=3446364 RepID=UPI003F702FD5
MAGDLFEPALILLAEHGGAFPSRLQRFGGIPGSEAGHAPPLLLFRRIGQAVRGSQRRLIRTLSFGEAVNARGGVAGVRNLAFGRCAPGSALLWTPPDHPPRRPAPAAGMSTVLSALAGPSGAP